MSRKTILLLLAEFAAMTILRLAYLMRRDKNMWPRASKVNSINGKPVFRNRPVSKEKKELSSEGWTPTFENGKITTPDSSPDA